MISLALVTALGGGVLRDLLLGATPPTAFSDVLYLVVPLSAATLVFVGHWLINQRVNRAVLIFDAAGLGLFCVTGAVKAFSFGTSAVGAVLIGVISAAGGGHHPRRSGERTPKYLSHRDSTLYAIPAALGATAVVVSLRNDFYSGGVAIGVAITVFLLRVAAMHFRWRAPSPFRSVAES